jgi:uncharacterized protein (DUF2141 family)
MKKVKKTGFCYYSFLTVLAAFLISCAQVGAPTGGPKDTQPPRIVKSFPENNSLEFKDNKIILSFDEFVQLKDVTNQLLISPPLSAIPEVKIKGKSVIVELKEPLKDSTTYTFNFGSAIADFNEGNVLDSNIFVFSTGFQLDSLSVTGIVTKAADNTPEKDVFVMLYANLADSAPYLEKPFYITRAKEDGSFAINNVRNGSYRIFALKDLNNNMLFDQPTEMVAFGDSIIHVDTLRHVSLGLFEELQEKQFLKKYEMAQYGKINLVFNKPVDSLNLILLNPAFNGDWYIEEWNSTRDSVSFWLTSLEDSIQSIDLIVGDFNTLSDTLNLKVGKKQKASSGKMGRGSPLVLTATTNASSAKPLGPENNLRIEFIHPLKNYDFSRAYLIKGADTLTAEFTLTKHPGARIFEVLHPWEEDSLYKLFIPPGLVTDIFNLENDTLSFDFKKDKIDAYGSLSLTLKIPEKEHQFIFRLYQAEKIISEHVLKKDELVSIGNLKPGNYTLKAIYDENNNGKWDSGIYLQKKQPEKILNYKGEITIRANWELELDWILEKTEIETLELDAE